MRATRRRLGDHLLHQAAHERRLVLVLQGLGQQDQRADGRAQLVADVRDEVGPHGLEARPLAHVLDERDGHAGAGSSRGGPHHHDAPRRAVEVEGLGARLAGQGARRFVRRLPPPTHRHSARRGSARPGVAQQHPLVVVDDDERRGAARRRRPAAGACAPPAPRRRPRASPRRARWPGARSRRS